MTDALTLIEEGIEAFRLTREYVGEDLLPAIGGWSWFDWTEKARRALDRPDTSLVAAIPPPPAPDLPLDVGAVEYAVHEAILALPPMHVRNTDAVPQAKRRPNAVVDRHAVIVAAKAAVRDALAEYARLAADAATDEAERVWSQKLPDGVPKG